MSADAGYAISEKKVSGFPKDIQIFNGTYPWLLRLVMLC